MDSDIRLTTAVIGRYKGCGHSEERAQWRHGGLPREGDIQVWFEGRVGVHQMEERRLLIQSLYPVPEASLGPAPLLGNAGDPEKSLTLPALREPLDMDTTIQWYPLESSSGCPHGIRRAREGPSPV